MGWRLQIFVLAFDERKLLLHEKSYKNGFLYIKYEKKNEKKKNIIIDDEEPITQRLHLESVSQFKN